MASHELQSWRREKNLAWLYRALSDRESGSPRQLLFLELATEADEQADLWTMEFLKTRQTPPGSYKPGLKVKTICWLIRRWGPENIRPVLAALKIRGLSVYSKSIPASYPTPSGRESTGMSEQRPGYFGSTSTMLLALNDGLIAIALLVIGIAAATEEMTIILLIGIAGLLVGSLLMATSEWLSIHTRRKAVEYSTVLSNDEIYPTEEARILAQIYRARGMGQEEAHILVKRMMDDPELGLDPLIREEPPPEPETPDSPWHAAMIYFFGFFFGGLIPLLPYLMDMRHRPLLAAISLSCISLLAIGLRTTLRTGGQVLWAGLGHLLIACLASAMAYMIGNFLGTRLG